MSQTLDVFFDIITALDIFIITTKELKGFRFLFKRLAYYLNFILKK